MRDKIVNQAAFDEAQKLREKIDNDPKKSYQCTDGTILQLNKVGLGEIIKSLPLSPEEIEHILDLYAPFQSNLIRLGLLNRKAYGIKNNPSTQRKTEKWKLHNELKETILSYFGKYYKGEEVLKILYTEYGFNDLQYSDIEEFYKKYIQQIIRLKEEYQANFDDLRLSVKKSRVEELTWLYNRLKDIFIDTDNIPVAAQMRGTLEQIKKEIDGDLVINGKLKLDVEVSVLQQLYVEHLKSFNITSLIVNHLAGRKNINPFYILSRLSNSFYSKDLGFSPKKADHQTEYPSDMAFNLDQMEILNGEWNTKFEPLKEFKQIEEAEIEPINNFKESLLMRLSQDDDRIKTMGDGQQ